MRSWFRRLGSVGLLAAGIAVSSDLLSYIAPSASLPATAAGWILSSPQDCAKPVPAQLRSLRGTAGARRVCHGEYGGSPQMTLTMYEMPQWGGSAFDAWQKWQAQPGKMSFYKGRYFGVVESPGADMDALNRFTVAVESALPPASEGRR
jgi:hypothetical protein